MNTTTNLILVAPITSGDILLYATAVALSVNHLATLLSSHPDVEFSNGIFVCLHAETVRD